MQMDYLLTIFLHSLHESADFLKKMTNSWNKNLGILSKQKGRFVGVFIIFLVL